ncbi:hypothetical protein K6V98_05985 [Collinsella sp. AGMB00827]|uniref:MFS transporter n=1 Tax=Collinsella ureilytica TaxID=2869515 RepID=A0ABS7MKK5_9ACTN|nr:hypothetical protein [Collinsella urealyticum]MBY4797899.1 hypothetical protein [Collinsella urealyticum]
MSVQMHTHPAIAAGIAGGIGLIAPAAVFVLTLPFEGIHELVRSSGAPFALGALAGAGLCAGSYVLLGASAEQSAQGAFALRDSADGESVQDAQQEVGSRYIGQHGRRFFGRRAYQEVPVIARAADALSEAEAWEEIDKLMNEDSPVSCDPATSKDIYQIALEELARTEYESQAEPQASLSASSAASYTGMTGHLAASGEKAADSTASTFVDSASHAARPVASDPIAPRSSAATLTEPGRQAALTALGVFELDEPDSIVNDNVLGLETQVAHEDASAVEASPAMMHSQVSHGAPASDFRDSALAHASSLVDETVADEAAVEVPMADYSGREDMWAQALAILAEDHDPSEVVSQAVVAQAEDDQEIPAAAPRVRSESVSPTSRRGRAVAEGERLTEIHGRVNEILGEEVAKVESRSMRGASREYLRVIQGGTASMPRLTVEA